MNHSTSSYIELKELRKSFKEGDETRAVLRGASATFQRGELAAILGRSGSGKSTLLNIMSGIDVADEGQVRMGGVDLTGMREAERTLFRRQHIGFVFQFFNLLPTLSVLENVCLPLELSGSDARSAKAAAEPLLAEVGLLDRISAFPDRLSGGEQQRVAIARALILDPILVLADEPTGNLDRKTGESVLTLLDTLTRQAGKNLILVTHSEESAAVADSVFRLEGGLLQRER
jgi:putative ABC transport system ATP-binding protein